MTQRVSPSFHSPTEALEDYVVKTVGKVAQCQTHSRRGHLIRGIAAEERFVDEITLLCLLIALTNLHQLRNIKGIQGTKEKRLTRSLPLLGIRTANRHPFDKG
jgi:hypothetical protein